MALHDLWIGNPTPQRVGFSVYVPGRGTISTVHIDGFGCSRVLASRPMEEIKAAIEAQEPFGLASVEATRSQNMSKFVPMIYSVDRAILREVIVGVYSRNNGYLKEEALERSDKSVAAAQEAVAENGGRPDTLEMTVEEVSDPLDPEAFTEHVAANPDKAKLSVKRGQ